MKFQRFLSLLLVLLACFVCSSHCYTFYVGGKEGWVLHPNQKYNDWAGKQRFQVNDVLIFKYEKGSDSVLLVKKDDYYKCERKHPLMEMSNGTSEFKFPHSGPFFFISGKEDHCSKGQKMITVVMAERHGTPSIHPPPIVKPPGKSPYPGPAQSPNHHHGGPIAYPPKGSSSSPAQSPEHHGPVAKPPTGSTPGPAQSPYHHGPISSPPSSVPTGSPMAHGPTPSTHHAPQYGPTQSPVAHGPTPSTHHAPQYGPTQSPVAHGPTPSTHHAPQYGPTRSPMAHGPTPSTHHAPQYGPTQSPVAHGPTANPPTSTSPSPSSSTPGGLSPAPSTGPGLSPPAPPQGISPSPTTSPSGSPVPSGNQTSTPPNGSSATATYSSVLVLAASVLFRGAMRDLDRDLGVLNLGQKEDEVLILTQSRNSTPISFYHLFRWERVIVRGAHVSMARLGSRVEGIPGIFFIVGMIVLIFLGLSLAISMKFSMLIRKIVRGRMTAKNIGEPLDRGVVTDTWEDSCEVEVVKLWNEVEGMLTTKLQHVSQGLDMGRLFSVEDVYTVVKSISQLKASAEDGLGALFYQRFWHIIGAESFLDVCIDESQSAFVPGCMITDNIIVAYEVLHSFVRKREGRKCYFALKLDMNKA
ncbi:formin-like protein 5-like [Hibiscus syriacus]|uniref:Formin-like protein 5-like n=1 Tax=Hibiscus syriacus TaxID=106335 RepID=A0A6A3AXZ2_HIBSY|nr:formin-like protein 5-like [Hibiscus syriacus]